METTQPTVLNRIVTVSDFLSSVVTLKNLGLAVVLFFTAIALIIFLQSLYRMRLLVAASSGGAKKMGPGAFFSALAESFGKILHNFMVLLPVLAGIIAALIAVTGVLKITVSVAEFIEREKRIRELSIAIKYLEQNQKVIDVCVVSVVDGMTKLRLSYSAQHIGGSSIPAADWKRDIEIRGTDIFFDCLVLNFTYSEVTSGRQSNIAVPYRIFSNIIAAKDGISLLQNVSDMPSEDDFGIIPAVYKERLNQLLFDAEFAKDMGVRSVNGNAAHRIVNTGDRFSVRVEQTGGLAIYEGW